MSEPSDAQPSDAQPSDTQQAPAASEKLPGAGTLLAYVDDEGRIHVVDSLAMIPREFWPRVRPAKLGEVSTISSAAAEGPAKTRSIAPRKSRAAPAQKPAQREPGDVSSKKEKAKHREQRLNQLQQRREQVLAALGVIDEGWAEDDSSAELSVKQLEARAAALSEELDTLDRAITKLQSGR